MNKYFYDGPVMEFDRVIMNRWKGETLAISDKKAKCNLAYQFKVKNQRLATAKITLPGKLTIV